MAVFATPVVDNFNRADENPLSATAGWATAQWQALVNSFSGPLKVASNAMRPAVEFGSSTLRCSQVRSAVLAADQECYLTLGSSFPGGSEYWLLARASAPGVAGGAGVAYALKLAFSFAGVSASLTISAIDQNLNSRDIVGIGSPGIPTNAKLGFRVFGSDPVHFEGWMYTGGAWSRLMAGVDSNAAQIRSSGRIGIYIFTNTNQASSVPLDDFGGGEAPPTTFGDVYPTFTGTREVRGPEAPGAKTSPMASWTYTRIVRQDPTLRKFRTIGLDLKANSLPVAMSSRTGTPIVTLPLTARPWYWFLVGSTTTADVEWSGGVSVY